jgi:hypothetical protein
LSEAGRGGAAEGEQRGMINPTTSLAVAAQAAKKKKKKKKITIENGGPG